MRYLIFLLLLSGCTFSVQVVPSEELKRFFPAEEKKVVIPKGIEQPVPMEPKKKVVEPKQDPLPVLVESPQRLGIEINDLIEFAQNRNPRLKEGCAKVNCANPEVRFVDISKEGVRDNAAGYTPWDGSYIAISNKVSVDQLDLMFIHEYVHYMQFKNGDFGPKARYGDKCALFGAEYEAYDTMNAYAKEIKKVPDIYGSGIHPIHKYLHDCIEEHRN